MALRIIGAGFGRTGTHSLALALEQLGFGPCYHLLEVDKNLGHNDLWDAAIDGSAIDWQALYRGYQSAVEWPTVAFLPQVVSSYPDAKIILTLRDAASWYNSASTTIFEGLSLSAHHPDPVRRQRGAMIRRLILDRTFAGRYRDRDYAIHVYEQHIREVIALVPPERLLQFSVTDGWELLCRFLNVPVPAEPFPRTNDRASFLSEMPDWAKRSRDQDRN